jgi:hypothetical protein
LLQRVDSAAVALRSVVRHESKLRIQAVAESLAIPNPSFLSSICHFNPIFVVWPSAFERLNLF